MTEIRYAALPYNRRAMLAFANRFQNMDDLLVQGTYISRRYLEAGLILFDAQLMSSRPASRKRGQTTHLMARAYRIQFEADGVRESLMLALENAVAAVCLPATDAERAHRHFTLATLKAMAYEVGGDYADLVGAIQSAESSVHLTDESDPEKCKRLCELGIVLRMRYMRSKDVEDLRLAIEAYRQASALNYAVQSPSVELGLAELWMTLALETENVETLRKAEKSSRRGLKMAEQRAEAYTHRAKSVLAHSLFLISTHEEPSHPIDAGVGAARQLDEAIQVLEDLVRGESQRGTQHTFILLRRLESAYAVRFTRSGHPRDGDRVMALLRRRFELPDLTAFQRSEMCKEMGESFARAEDWETAVSFFNDAIVALGEAASQLHARLDQEHLFSNLATLASDAAYACCMNDDPQRGLVLYAAARGVLVRAKRFRDKLLRELRIIDGQAVDDFEVLLDVANQQQRAMQLELGGAEFAGVTQAHLAVAVKGLERIAAENGLAASLTYFAPFGMEDVELDLGGSGDPLVAISVGTLGSCVFVLANDQFNGLSTELTRETIAKTVAAFLANADAAIGNPLHTSQESRALMDTLLGLIGTHFVTPALDLVRTCGSTVEGATIRWCLSGYLQMLPWCAVPIGVKSDGAPLRLVDVAATTIVSHISFRGHGRRDLGVSDLKEALLVAMPRTPGRAPLTQALGEIEDISVIIGVGPEAQPRIRVGYHATRDELLGAMPHARLIHLACHARVDHENPARSRILLSDHEENPLTIGDIAAVRAATGGLAYLSGCSTGRAVGALAEESLDLASAFEFAGFDRVVGTLWPVRDGDSRLAANAFYTSLLALGAESERHELRPAEALRAATLRLREMDPNDLLRWASYFVLGGG